MQLDLFLDSHEVVLANQVVEALLARDGMRATTAFAALAHDGPDHPALPALKILSCALAGWDPPEAQSAAIAQRMAWLEQDVVPAATAALGASAHQFLHPFLVELAEAARGLQYDAHHPCAYRAYICVQCGDYSGAEQAVLATPDWVQNRDALHWLSVARYRRDGLDAARGTVFQLAWREPARLAALLTELDDRLLLREWNAFEAACPWRGIAEHELASWFPAWYLMEHPGAAGAFRDMTLPDTPATIAVRLLLRLLELEREADVRALSTQRARLRELNPDLFTLYMARRTVQHR